MHRLVLRNVGLFLLFTKTEKCLELIGITLQGSCALDEFLADAKTIWQQSQCGIYQCFEPRTWSCL
jgi:hypothetical protein